jgi:hypothetical protein
MFLLLTKNFLSTQLFCIHDEILACNYILNNSVTCTTSSSLSAMVTDSFQYFCTFTPSRWDALELLTVSTTRTCTRMPHNYFQYTHFVTIFDRSPQNKGKINQYYNNHLWELCKFVFQTQCNILVFSSSLGRHPDLNRKSESFTH